MKYYLKAMKPLCKPDWMKIHKMPPHGTLCVCETHTALQVSQPTVAKRLKLLEEGGLLPGVSTFRPYQPNLLERAGHEAYRHERFLSKVSFAKRFERIGAPGMSEHRIRLLPIETTKRGGIMSI